MSERASGSSPSARLWAALRAQWLFLLVAGLYAWAFATRPALGRQALVVSGLTFGEVVLIIAAVFGLVGLFQVWINQEQVTRLLGREGGFRALVLAALCGTVLVGPPYIIFPLLLTLRRQGARWAVITTLLAAWAVKIPMIPLEVQFLGWKFSLLRTALTILAAIPIGLLVEFLMEPRSRRRLSPQKK